MLFQKEEATLTATYSPNSPPAKEQKEGLMQAFRLHAAIPGKHPPPQWVPPCSQMEARLSAQVLKEIREDKNDQSGELEPGEFFLLRKGKEGSVCQGTDAAAVNSSKCQQRAVGSQKLRRKGGAWERRTWKLCRWSKYFCCSEMSERLVHWSAWLAVVHMERQTLWR